MKTKLFFCQKRIHARVRFRVCFVPKKSFLCFSFLHARRHNHNCNMTYSVFFRCFVFVSKIFFFSPFEQNLSKYFVTLRNTHTSSSATQRRRRREINQLFPIWTTTTKSYTFSLAVSCILSAFVSQPNNWYSFSPPPARASKEAEAAGDEDEDAAAAVLLQS